MANKKREYPPLSEAQLELCPNGDPSCRICRLRPDQIKDIHDKRIKHKLTIKKMREYLKKEYKIGDDYTRVCRHFNTHMVGRKIIHQALEVKKKHVKYPEITSILEPISDNVKVKTHEDIEKAYASLVRMSYTFVNEVNKIQDQIKIQIGKRKVEDELDGVPVMDLLERLGKLNKESREFIKEISALRAPKVMVAQFLESFIDTIIKEMSTIFGNLCGDIQQQVMSELADAGYKDVITTAVFIAAFKEIALDYRDRMITLKRQQMSDALAALQDLEKLI